MGATLVSAGAALVAVSGFLVWLDVLGSQLTGYRLAELLTSFGDDLQGVPPSWVGLVWYLFPVCATLCWLVVFRRTPASASAVHLPLGLTIVAAAAAYSAWADVQLGPITAVIGGLGVAAGGAVAMARTV